MSHLRWISDLAKTGMRHIEPREDYLDGESEQLLIFKLCVNCFK